MGDTINMGNLSGILTKLSGSVGQFTFKRVNGKTVVSEKITHTTNPRTAAQNRHRLKWANVVKLYSGIAPLLNFAFEKKANGISDYNQFMKLNIKGGEVYLTKDEAGANACVIAPCVLSNGSLNSIETSGNFGATKTNIFLDGLSINAQTTIRDISNAIVSTNPDYDYGDKISFIFGEQESDSIAGYPKAKFVGSTLELDKNSTTPLYSVVNSKGFYTVDGYLGCAMDEGFQGGYAWIHSRKDATGTKVSNQQLIVSNNILGDYTSEEAYQAAVESYGGEKKAFLAPEYENVKTRNNIGGW